MTSPRREKAAPVGQEAALGVTNQPMNNTLSDRLRGADPLQGWFDLAKPARSRQQKKSWNRKQRGFADLWLMLSLFQINCFVLAILWGASL
jgi:hypothetical protein